VGVTIAQQCARVIPGEWHTDDNEHWTDAETATLSVSHEPPHWYAWLMSTHGDHSSRGDTCREAIDKVRASAEAAGLVWPW